MTTPPLINLALHDATVIGLRADVRSRRTTVVFRMDEGGEVSLIADGTMTVTATMSMPWGPSASINELRWNLGGGSEPASVEIEIQSGDIITIVASKFSLEEAGVGRSGEDG